VSQIAVTFEREGEFVHVNTYMDYWWRQASFQLGTAMELSPAHETPM
jgi:hypothetical protein